jgi:hypothetical protein
VYRSAMNMVKVHVAQRTARGAVTARVKCTNRQYTKLLTCKNLQLLILLRIALEHDGGIS